VVYYVNYKEGTSHLVAARGRVNSNEKHSIPRLEFMGEEVSLRLVVQVCRALDYPPSRALYFADSRNVLCWLRSPGRDCERVIARQAAEIREATDPNQWMYVKTGDNPANVLSRGEGIDRLMNNWLWARGPEFLLTKDWPEHGIPADPNQALPHEKQLLRLIGIHTAVAQQMDGSDPMERFGSWKKATRIYGHVAVFISKCKKERQPWSQEAGERLVLKATQRFYWKEYEMMQKNGALPFKHDWRRFDTELVEGVMEVKGRIDRVGKPMLPGSSAAAQRLVWAAHADNMKHMGGKNTAFNEVQKKYWILGNKAKATSLVKGCTPCRMKNPVPLEQKMGAPERRALFRT
jgi:hypothetical protein